MRKTKQEFECTFAHSPFYKEGNVYPLWYDNNRVEYFQAEDGLFDKKSVLLSKFKKVE